MFIPRPEPTFSIVIPTYGRPRGLARLLNSLGPQVIGRHGREVIVVNDGSQEPAYEAIVNRHRGWVNYIATRENRGQSAARNTGVAAATGNYLVFIDDDCAAPLDWLDRLTAIFAADPTLDAVGGRTKPLQSQYPRWFEKLLIESQGRRQSDELLAKAESEAAKIQGEGEAEALRIRNTAQARDPEFYELLRTLDGYRKMLNSRTTVVRAA